MAISLKLDKPQVFFHVKEVTGECVVKAVVCALRNLYVGATVRIDLALRRVEIHPKTAEPAALLQSTSNAGYGAVRQRLSDRAHLWA
jgi:hypothetical protein